jgi:hypothetical protein
MTGPRYKRETVEEVLPEDWVETQCHFPVLGALSIQRGPNNTVELTVNSFRYDYLGETSNSISVSREQLINALHRI